MESDLKSINPQAAQAFQDNNKSPESNLGSLNTSELFYQLFECAPDGIVVVNEKGYITHVNAHIEKQFGYQREELIGYPIEKLIPDRFKNRHIEHRKQYLTEPRTRSMGAGLELYARRKDGSEFPVDIMLSPLQIKESKLALAVVRDVTERKQVEILAKENQEMFFRLFEFAPDAIVVVDTEGYITKANDKTEKLFGYNREEFIGKPVETLIPERFIGKHTHHRSSYLYAPRTRPMGAGLELYARRKDDSEFPVDIMLSPIEMQGDSLVLCVVRDITERKNAEVQQREVQRREMLLKEIHHRVKNNLQVIASLLYLQSTYVKDPLTIEILKESQNRAKSIALIHEKLYRSENLEKLNFSEYAHDLVSLLTRTYGVNKDGIVVTIDIENVFLGIETAIPCGLIINELVSNAFKHAFPSGGGVLSVELHPTPDAKYILSVRDTGIGMPADFNWQKNQSLGLKLVSDLTKQLEGTLTIDVQKGTGFQISFSELEYKERR